MSEKVNLLKALESIGNPDFKMPQYDFSKIKIPEYDFKIPEQYLDVSNFEIPENPLIKLAEEQNLQFEENNKHLRNLVEYNKNISNYNAELVTLNNKILNKINSLDETLIFLNESFLEKVEVDIVNEIEKKALLLELITIIDSQDKGKVNSFMLPLSGTVAAGVIIEYFKVKLGLI